MFGACHNARIAFYFLLFVACMFSVGEEQCLQQIYVDEMYGGQEVKVKDKERQEEKAKYVLMLKLRRLVWGQILAFLLFHSHGPATC